MGFSSLHAINDIIYSDSSLQDVRSYIEFPTLHDISYPDIPPSRLQGVNDLIRSYNSKVEIYNKNYTEAQKQQSSKDDKEYKLIMAISTTFFILILCVGRTFIESSIMTFVIFIVCAAIVGRFFNYVDFPKSTEIRNLLENIVNNVHIIDKEVHEIRQREFNVRQYELQKKRSYWTNLSGFDFERKIAELYSSMNYNVQLTKGTGDGGIDIFISKNNTKYAVQCKNHKNPIGPSAIRDLYGAMRHEDIDNGIFISSGGYTNGSKDFACGKKIELLDINDIIQMHQNITPPSFQ